MNGFTLEEIVVSHGRTRLLDRISISLPAGQCTAVVGPSGAGKSTLLRLLNRMTEPSSGRVLLDGTSIVELDVLALRRRVGLVGQRPVLLTDLVADELRVGADVPDARLGDLLARVGLPAEFARRKTGDLSGGEAQRVCLARALAVQPEVLLLDEPTSALDGLNAAVIGDLVHAHVGSGGSVVLVSHDRGIVRALADQVVVLDKGQLVAVGAPDEVNYLEAR